MITNMLTIYSTDGAKTIIEVQSTDGADLTMEI